MSNGLNCGALLPLLASVLLAMSTAYAQTTRYVGDDAPADPLFVDPDGRQPGASLGAPHQGEDAAAASPETVAPNHREAEQEVFGTPTAPCGLLSQAFLPVAILGMSLARSQRQRGSF